MFGEGLALLLLKLQVSFKRMSGGGADGNGGVEGHCSFLAALSPSPLPTPAHQGRVLWKVQSSKWTYGDFIILAFLPKAFPVLLQHTTGAPTPHRGCSPCGFVISNPSAHTGSPA